MLNEEGLREEEGIWSVFGRLLHKSSRIASPLILSRQEDFGVCDDRQYILCKHFLYRNDISPSFDMYF